MTELELLSAINDNLQDVLYGGVLAFLLIYSGMFINKQGRSL